MQGKIKGGRGEGVFRKQTKIKEKPSITDLQGEKVLQITNRSGNRSCEIVAREIPENIVKQEASST
jgi:hypothetical protein